MTRTIVLTFTAAVLLMAAAVALGAYGRDSFEHHRAAAEEVLPLTIYECFDCDLLNSWEKAADVTWLLALGVLIAGIKLSAAETQPPHRVSMLGLHASMPRRIVRADATRLPRLHDDEGLTPLERVIRAS
jgi:hypothetical protein